MKVRHVNRGQKRGYSPVVRALHRSQVQIRCPHCHSTRLVWYDRIPDDAPEHEAARLIQCPERRCGVTLWAYVPPVWRAYAEAWRPWQRVLDQLWTPSDGPEPRPPSGDPPTPIIPKLAERTMEARHAYYMLTTRRELAAVILRSEEQPAADLWAGAEVEVADLYLFVPEDPDDLAALLESHPAIAALHEQTPLQPGEPLELQGVARGLDTDCWWPLRGQQASVDHYALDEAAPTLDADTDTDPDDDTEDGWVDAEEVAEDAEELVEEPAQGSPPPADPEPPADLEPTPIDVALVPESEPEPPAQDVAVARWMANLQLGAATTLVPEPS